MKTILMLILVLIPSFAFAEKDFSERKTKMLSNLEERISHLQTQKNCVSSANDAAALKKCLQAMKEWRQSKRKEMMGTRKGHHRKHKNHMMMDDNDDMMED